MSNEKETITFKRHVNSVSVPGESPKSSSNIKSKTYNITQEISGEEIAKSILLEEYYFNRLLDNIINPNALYEIAIKEPCRDGYKKQKQSTWYLFKTAISSFIHNIKYSIACWLYGEDIEDAIFRAGDGY